MRMSAGFRPASASKIHCLFNWAGCWCHFHWLIVDLELIFFVANYWANSYVLFVCDDFWFPNSAQFRLFSMPISFDRTESHTVDTHTLTHKCCLFFESNVSRRDDHKHSKRLSRFLQLTRYSLLAYSRRFVLSNPIHLLSVRKLPKRTHLKEEQTAVSSVWPIDVPSRMAVDLMVDCAIINLRFWITTISWETHLLHIPAKNTNANYKSQILRL